MPKDEQLEDMPSAAVITTPIANSSTLSAPVAILAAGEADPEALLRVLRRNHHQEPQYARGLHTGRPRLLRLDRRPRPLPP